MSAKLACENDEACGGVYDQRCNFTGEIKLFKKGAEEIPSAIGSCIHIKDQQIPSDSSVQTSKN